MNRFRKISFAYILSLATLALPGSLPAQARPLEALAQKVSENPAPKSKKVKALSPFELNQVYGRRMVAELGCPFYQFSKIFIVSSPLKLKYSVLLGSQSPIILSKPLMNFYPNFYRPTFKEILDQIALQTGSSWHYQPNKEKYKAKLDLYQPSHEVLVFEFNQANRSPSFKLKLAPGWRKTVKPNSVMFIPPTCPMGLDIYDIGTFSTDEVSEAQQKALMKRVRKEICLKFASSAKKSVQEAELKKAKVGDYNALYFETEVPTKTGYKARWRQWAFTVEDRCFIAVSTIFPTYEEKLWPQVQEMLTSFELEDGKETGSK